MPLRITKEKLAKPVAEAGAVAFFSPAKERVNNKSSGMWLCQGRKKDTHGGHVYTFKLKDKYNYFKFPEDKETRPAVETKTQKSWPAIENDFPWVRLLVDDFTPDNWMKNVITDTLEASLNRYYKHNAPNKSVLTEVKYLLNDELKSDIKRINQDMDAFDFFIEVRRICLQAIKDGRLTADEVRQKKRFFGTYEHEQKRNAILSQLGYRVHFEDDGDITLTLPNRNALLARWKVLMKHHRNLKLPPIDIVSSKDAASDSEFIKSFLLHDGLLSSGKEFIHDHMVHIASLIELIFDNDDKALTHRQRYINEKGRIRGIVRQAYTIIAQVKEKIASGELSFDIYESKEAKRRGEGRPITVDDLLPLECSLSMLTDTFSSFSHYHSTTKPNFAMLGKDNVFSSIVATCQEDYFTQYWRKQHEGDEERQQLANPFKLKEIWDRISTPEAFEQDHSAQLAR